MSRPVSSRATTVSALLIITSLLAWSAKEAESAGRMRSWSIMQDGTPFLKYYVQAGLTAAYLGELIPPLNSTQSTFGQTKLFAFNVTEGEDATSRLLGSMRGYTVQASATPDYHSVEVEVLEYNDGSLNGTISLQGIVTVGKTNEIAVVGGTGDFRGIRGYAVISFISSSDTLALYYHELFVY
ncbi:hypothetical protein KP509_08G034000 [Ceratopteris richardii]|uniref:Dirigent protein n=1 Tax=Ceratopteris richardii TaxID=49495 RepID=A0A8T2U902_CERRI|nr:hypothetical protein KP509_08G034000 [Ceratopteris richardii]